MSPLRTVLGGALFAVLASACAGRVVAAGHRPVSRSLRGALAAVALVALLAGCGSSQADVETAFRGYHTALLARDFPTACSYNTPEATDRLLASLRTQAIDAGTCEEAFAAIYAEDGGSAQADGVGRTVQITKITVAGDTATVDWTAELDGEQRPASSTMRRVAGRWQFVAD